MFTQDLIEKIRAEFPGAAIDLNGRKRAFLDNGTGTLAVGRAAIAEYETRIACSPSSGGSYDESAKTTEIITKGRQNIADFLNAPSPDTIVSGESATSLFFALSYAIGKECNGSENIVTTDYDHYSNVSPWLELGKRNKIQEVRQAGLHKPDGTLNMEHLGSLIDSKTKVVAVSAASNLLGSKSQLDEIGKMAREVDAHYVIDAVHHIAHGPLDVQALNADFLVFSGYKIFSSHGSFLYGKEELLESLHPYKVEPAPDHGPRKWESGMRNAPLFAAMSGAVDHLIWVAGQVQSQYTGQYTNFTENKRALKIAMDATEKYELDLSKAVIKGFDDIPGIVNIPKVKVYGLTDLNRIQERDPTFSFKVENMPDPEVVTRLWKDGAIASRASNFYSYARHVYNQPTVVRISLVQYNTVEEIRGFLKTLNKICTTG